MTHVDSMLDAHPPQGSGNIDKAKSTECIQACRRCEQACADVLASLG